MSVLNVIPRQSLSRLCAFALCAAAVAFSAPAETKPWSVSVVDDSGYAVQLNKAPQSIISLTLASDEILFSLVERSRLKGITFLSVDPGISNIEAAARDFPTRLTGDTEQIIALQPDLVVIADWKEAQFAQALRQAGIAVFVLHSPETFAELWTNIRLLAKLTDRQAQGEAIIASCQARLRRVKDREAGLADSARLSILSYSLYGSSYGGNTSFNAIAQAAGVRNASADYRGWPLLSKEQILTIDPDILMLPGWSFKGSVDATNYKSRFLADPVFHSLKAIRNQRVISLPDAHFMANSQYMVDAVEDLARAAYPELFK